MAESIIAPAGVAATEPRAAGTVAGTAAAAESETDMAPNRTRAKATTRASAGASDCSATDSAGSAAGSSATRDPVHGQNTALSESLPEDRLVVISLFLGWGMGMTYASSQARSLLTGFAHACWPFLMYTTTNGKGGRSKIIQGLANASIDTYAFNIHGKAQIMRQICTEIVLVRDNNVYRFG
jgi:hypothetical protein